MRYYTHNKAVCICVNTDLLLDVQSWGRKQDWDTCPIRRVSTLLSCLCWVRVWNSLEGRAEKRQIGFIKKKKIKQSVKSSWQTDKKCYCGSSVTSRDVKACQRAAVLHKLVNVYTGPSFVLWNVSPCLICLSSHTHTRPHTHRKECSVIAGSETALQKLRFNILEMMYESRLYH